MNANTLSLESGTVSGTNVLLSKDGYAGTYVNTPGGTVTVTLTATPTFSSGPSPHLNVVMADTKVGCDLAAGSNSCVATFPNMPAGNYFIRNEYANDGTTITLERETLHVTDGDKPVALAETRTIGTDKGLAELVRYQLGNHLGSAVLELNDRSDIISYEEYFPFGSTSYQAVASQTGVPKRYRYTGKERDEENDLSYHGARYYAPWLGRWTSCDPAGITAGLNAYLYARSNPVRLVDPNGMQPEPVEDPPTIGEETIYVYGTCDALCSAVAGGIAAPERARGQVAAELAQESYSHVDPNSLYGQVYYDARTIDPVGANERWQQRVSETIEEGHQIALAKLEENYRGIDAAAGVGNVIAGFTVVAVAGLGAIAGITAYGGVAGTYSLATSANTAITAAGGTTAAGVLANELEEAAPAVETVEAEVEATEAESQAGGNDLALGLTRSPKSGNTLLKPFADSVGAKTWTDPAFDDLVSLRQSGASWGNICSKIIDRTVASGGRIHFNLAELVPSLGGTTANELSYIQSNLALMAKTIFYSGPLQ